MIVEPAQQPVNAIQEKTIDSLTIGTTQALENGIQKAVKSIQNTENLFEQFSSAEGIARCTSQEAQNVLLLAIEHKRLDLIDQLFDNQEYIDKLSPKAKRKAFVFAVQKKQFLTLCALMEMKETRQALYGREISAAFMIAAQNRDFRTMTHLLDDFWFPMYIDDCAYEVTLQKAAESGDEKLVDFLLSKNKFVQKLSEEGATAAEHKAEMGGHTSIARSIRETIEDKKEAEEKRKQQ